MILRKLSLLLIVLTFIGCNQSDPNTDTASENNNLESKESVNDNTPVEQAEPQREGKIVARVNGQPIYEDDVERKGSGFYNYRRNSVSRRYETRP